MILLLIEKTEDETFVKLYVAQFLQVIADNCKRDCHDRIHDNVYFCSNYPDETCVAYKFTCTLKNTVTTESHVRY